MNVFLKKLFELIAIDIPHLHSYLSSSELQYLDRKLKSKADLDSDFYTDGEGLNLEMLLHFLICHKKEIDQLWDDPSKKHILISLYTSSTISGNYDCFRFDLNKFEQTYNPIGEELLIYRVGRESENDISLGHSWSKSHSGLRTYAQSSSINALDRPVFQAKINDSEILSEINSQEDELILKKDFLPISCRELNQNEREKIFI
jgi:hypothetical protein